MFHLIILVYILQTCFLWTLFPLTFQIFPELELDTKDKYLSPPKVFPLQEQKKKDFKLKELKIRGWFSDEEEKSNSYFSSRLKTSEASILFLCY